MGKKKINTIIKIILLLIISISCNSSDRNSGKPSSISDTERFNTYLKKYCDFIIPEAPHNFIVIWLKSCASCELGFIDFIHQQEFIANLTLILSIPGKRKEMVNDSIIQKYPVCFDTRDMIVRSGITISGPTLIKTDKGEITRIIYLRPHDFEDRQTFTSLLK